ncbi:tRNA uridine-5-carboxymethylaminomethyl(34) synthesis GTPase MnmE, partial [bacterium]
MIQRLAFDDTIAAIATAPGEGGIGIIKISGPKSVEIADKIFFSKNNKRASEFKNYTLHYGWVKDKQGSFVDEALLSIMRKPSSYTKEDVVEINSHGGIIALRRILDLVLENGCRLAEPGEFTKRAFLNGRIDLSQAEAVLDIIRSKTDAALKLSTEQLKGNLSLRINKIRQELISVLSILEASIDFPEDDPG